MFSFLKKNRSRKHDTGATQITGKEVESKKNHQHEIFFVFNSLLFSIRVHKRIDFDLIFETSNYNDAL